jgi:hypothetical protein
MTMSAEPAPLGVTQGGRIPDFFIVGHHKSGTTALYEMLRRHPQIYMPDLKEPRFFAADLRSLAGPSSASRLPSTLDEYLALFGQATPGQRVGEASPSYLRSQTAAREIAALQPRARCIAILREPASFVRSLHLQLLQEHVEDEKDLGRALSKEDIIRNGRPVRRYSDHIHYVEQLSRFEAVFPPEQLLVLIYDDFRRENLQTVRRVLRFLQVDDAAPLEVIEANPTVGIRSLYLDGVVRALYGERGPLSRVTKAAVRTLVPDRLRREAMRSLRRRVVYREPDPPDERLMRELRGRYRPEVVALSEHLGRDLVALWGYDRVG